MLQTSARGAGITRLRLARANGPGSTGELAEVADQQQVLQVRHERREALEGLDRLLAAFPVARPERRAEQLLEQRRLAFRRGPEDAAIARRGPVARELAHRSH